MASPSQVDEANARLKFSAEVGTSATMKKEEGETNLEESWPEEKEEATKHKTPTCQEQ